MKTIWLCSISPLLLLPPAAAHAVWFRSSSVEWEMDLADIVVIGRVQATKSIQPLNEYWDSQQVTCTAVEAVKGEWSESLSFRQDYRSLRNPAKGNDRRLEKGERMLLFLHKASDQEPPEVDTWFNLSHPVSEAGPSSHAAYNNTCKVLADETSILKLARQRAKENRKSQRGLIVPFQALGDYTHQFVITAEPEFKQQFVVQLQSASSSDRCDAIFNLVSYPSDETRRLIRPLLNDPATTSVGNYNGEGRDITYFPVRQAAYAALALLDDHPPLPKPYFDKMLPFLFKTGFDNETYFPRGKWKRLKDIVDSPPEYPFDFLKGRKPVKESHNWQHLDYAYAFQADFARTRAAVEKELLSKGFTIAQDDARGFGRAWRSVEYKRGNELVVIFQNMRYEVPKADDSAYSLIGVDVEGWVSFQVVLERTTGSRPQQPVRHRR